MQEITSSELLPHKERRKVCIIDDDQSLLTLLSTYLTRKEFAVKTYTLPTPAIAEINQMEFDLVICDLMLPEMSGIEVVKLIKANHKNLPVVMMTANGCTDSAIEALNLGAFDYINKPLNLAEFEVIASRAIAQSDLLKKFDLLQAKQEEDASSRYGTLLGKSVKMRELFELMARLSGSSANVLVTGESGTGKELVARTLHDKSKRARGPFIAVNCAAIPEELLESELFGHTKGAFTGADRVRKGLFEEAHQGTIFLDEIGDMALSLQAKLLRVLQDKTVRQVGSNITKDLDIRVIAATNKDLKKEIQAGRFREDLYYRLAVMPLHIPPLRDRADDIPLLANHFLAKFSRYSDSPKSNIVGFSKSAMAKLSSYSWPGNVRELENTLERAVILCSDGYIEENEISMIDDTNQNEPSIYRSFNKMPTVEQLEDEYIQYVMIKTDGHREKAAHILGIDRKTLYRRLNHMTTAGQPQQPVAVANQLNH